MISMVKVWNDNTLPYKEVFEEKQIVIEPSRFVLMDYEKAIKFRGTFAPIKVDAGGVQLKESYKKIRLEVIKGTKEMSDATKHLCQSCKYLAISEKDLDDHIDSKHLDQLIDEEYKKKRLKRLDEQPAKV